MVCRNCGTEIADKAIVCYRCGTPTTEAARKPAEIRRRRSPLVALMVIIAALLLALLLARHYHVFGLEYVVYSVAVLIDFPAPHA